MTPLMSYFGWIRFFFALTLWSLFCMFGINVLLGWVSVIIIGILLPEPDESAILTPTQQRIINFIQNTNKQVRP
jgi:hypothetical protein